LFSSFRYKGNGQNPILVSVLALTEFTNPTILDDLPMRLDKYLKVSRLVKRRTVASELCQGSHVKINGHAAKAAATVKVGDLLQIRFGSRLIIARIVRVPEKAVPAQEAESLYALEGGELLDGAEGHDDDDEED
jgi:ribosomal 50S subunit-recycling heat shock protein